MWCASRRPPWGVCLFVSLFAVSRRFSLQPSCHLAAVPLSSVSPLSLPPLSRRSLLPRPATPPPAGPLFSRLLSSIVVFVSIEVSRVLGVLGAATALRCHGARPAERRPSRTAVTIYPTSIVDGKLENCASKVAQIRLSRRAELVSPVRQQALLHSRACPTGSC